MGSTPLNHSDTEPSENTEPAAAAAESDESPGGPMDVDEPETAPSEIASDAVDETEGDTQELSREEVAAIIAADNAARDDVGDTDRSGDGPQQAAEESLKTVSPDSTADDQAESDKTVSDSPTPHVDAGPQEPSGPTVEDEPDPETVAAEAPAETCGPPGAADLVRFGLWGAGLVVLLVILAAFGFSYLGNRRPEGALVEKQPTADARLKTSPSDESHGATDPVAKNAPAIDSPANGPLLSLEVKQAQMDALRDQMLAKAEEIANLRHNYRESIRQIEAALLMEKRYAGFDSLQQALESKRIALQLETIRRRQAYIDCLVKPAEWLLQGSEELLFLKRKHLLQSLVFPVCSRIDPEKLAAEKAAAIDYYTNSADALKVDLQKISYQTLDQVWQGLLEHERQAAPERNPTAAATRRESGDGQQVNSRSIWREICQGRFSRKGELTALSVDAAECLAGWKEPDLFLNRIEQLSPAVASRLFKWKGNWFCLNGLTELPPEIAEHLFRWNGQWLSLNGVKHLSFESSVFLNGWKGRTLELMGLSPETMEREAVALKHLAQWQKSGGKLFVPDRVRQMLANSS